MSTIKQVFITGLYLYATEKRVPAGFTHEMMQSAFRPKD